MSASNLHLMNQDLEDTSDDSLIAGIASGRTDALTVLFRRRQGDVYRFVLHLTGLPAVAEDVTQDVFVIVMREAGRYRAGRSTVAAWLCGIARNCARQRLERDRRLASLEDESTTSDRHVPLVHPDPLAELTQVERLGMLRRAVLALPLRYREVVVLCDLQELSYAEAADILGCAVGTVRSRLHRARGLLSAKVNVMNADAGNGRRPADARRAQSVDPPAGPEHSAPARSQRKCLA